ncbi:MAG: SHOCT domain-containing protein [Puniceicoccales bacterium]|jgi:hypothetical protein|nr:SHOCT domain-containing protein [Puniceicoccales bacterium]
MKKTVLLSAGLLFFSVFISGCVSVVDNSSHSRSSNTLGRELIDLDTVRATGIITEAEYQEQRNRLLHPESKK